ncbi:MAG: amidohydrolase family protein [Chloroflexi bacterium]|nr:amidohydrolase family protein [Chloroflexota bacterium]
MQSEISRRDFLTASALLLLNSKMAAAESPGAAEPVIDIHQHTTYAGRTAGQLLAHQQAMGISQTVLLPAGRMYGLDAQCGGNASVFELTRKHPKQFAFFANEVADLPEAREEITAYLKRGAIGIGEQKFNVPCDSEPIERLAETAQEFDVPVLLHFQHGVYNTGLERFHKILEKYPKVNFLGHAQTWWGNIDKNHDQTVLYPTGPVTPGGLTDRLLRDYPNMYGDLSAGSGLNALIRDEEHTRGFFERHQDKLLFGSDCNDTIGRGPGCQGAQTLAAIRRLAPSKAVERKLLFENAKRLLRL